MTSRIHVFFGQLVAGWPQVAIRRRLPIGGWPYWPIYGGGNVNDLLIEPYTPKDSFALDSLERIDI